MDLQKRIINDIHKYYLMFQPMTTSKVVNKISYKLYKTLNVNDDEFIELCDSLMSKNEWILFQMVTDWIKTRKTVYKIKYFHI